MGYSSPVYKTLVYKCNETDVSEKASSLPLMTCHASSGGTQAVTPLRQLPLDTSQCCGHTGAHKRTREPPRANTLRKMSLLL